MKPVPGPTGAKGPVSPDKRIAPNTKLDPRQFASPLEFQTEIRIRLLGTFAKPDYSPPVLPAVAIELVRLSHRSNTGLADVVKVLEHDPVLAADVLRLAQSAAYSAGSEVRSIQDAVNRIGLARVADLFLRVALESKIFKVPGYSAQLEKLRRHSIATAEISRLIIERIHRREQRAYICGLLHDIGIAGALLALGAEETIAKGIEFSVIWPALSSVHPQFTVQLAQLWNLPEDLRTILRHHHTFGAIDHPVDLAAVTVLAEIMADGVGYGFQGEQADCMIDRACRALMLTAGDLEAMERKARETLDPLMR